MSREKTQIGVYLPVKLVEIIDKIAQEEHRSRNWVVNKAIKNYIEYLGYLEDLTPPEATKEAENGQ